MLVLNEPTTATKRAVGSRSCFRGGFRRQARGGEKRGGWWELLRRAEGPSKSGEAAEAVRRQEGEANLSFGAARRAGWGAPQEAARVGAGICSGGAREAID
jgi:hypothetical protein